VVKEAEEQKVAEAMAERLGALDISIAKKVGETEALYGSVTTADIAEALKAKGFGLDRRKLHLAEPIKRLGEFDVSVKLHPMSRRTSRCASSLKALRSKALLHSRTPPAPFCMPEAVAERTLRTISKPNDPSWARSCSTTTRSISPPK